MSLLQAISDFFESLFNKNSPEVQKKIQLRKLDNELRSQEPLVFKNGKLLPNFAETIRLLYLNTKPLNTLMTDTIYGPDIPRNMRFEHQLVLTGFNEQNQQLVESLEYESRKQQLFNSAMTTSQIFDKQHKTLDKIIHELNTETFVKIDRDLNTLHQLGDFCRFNFVTILQIFDPNFVSADPRYQPSYQEISIERVANILEDLYFITKGMNLTVSTMNAITALASLRAGGSALQEDSESIRENLKKIAYILKHVISPERIRLMICYAKGDLNYTPANAEYKESARKHFSEMLQNKFKADEQRIKTEMKDAKINSELSNLFGTTDLLTLNGYNNDTNAKLLANAQMTFAWIMPMRILKTFLAMYMSDSIKALLNDIIVEGFFNNPQFKSDFAADIFAALESSNEVQEFENSFNRGEQNSTTTLDGYIHDSHNDPEFFKKLEQMVVNINNQANKLISREINNLNKVSKHIDSLLQDSKKPTSEIISNLKVLMMSSRNRDNTDLLEQQFPKWELFFEIMKNYAIISN